MKSFCYILIIFWCAGGLFSFVITIRPQIEYWISWIAAADPDHELHEYRLQLQHLLRKERQRQFMKIKTRIAVMKLLDKYLD